MIQTISHKFKSKRWSPIVVKNTMSRHENKNKIILSKSETEKTPFFKEIIFEFKFIELNSTNFQFSFENGKNLV